MLTRATRLLARSPGRDGGTRTAVLARRLGVELLRQGGEALSALLLRAERGEGDALQALRGLLTVQYSTFWREAAHWPIVAEHLHTRLRAGHPVRLWSAACAAGQEAYSLAIAAAEAARALVRPSADWRVLGTDLDPGALARARAGLYGADTLAPLPPALRARHLRPVDSHSPPRWAVDDALRAKVDWQVLDLADARQPWPSLPGEPFDVVVLANVLIYLDRPAQARVLARVAERLRPDGIVLTSRSEGQLSLAAPRLRPCGDCAYRLAPPRSPL